MDYKQFRMLEILEAKWIELSLKGEHEDAYRIYEKIKEVKRINRMEDLDNELYRKIEWSIIKGRNTSTTDTDVAQRIFKLVENYINLREF